jgi:predicted LPLAT superfamily acyltransferase
MNEDRWAQVAESGTLHALRFVAWWHRLLGRGPSVALLWLPAVYFALRSRPARRASRRYLERVWATPEGRRSLRRRPGFGDVVRHLHTFAVALYDRMLVWGGALDSIRVEHDGSEKIFEVAQGRRGALLLGAHLGSIDMLWFLSRKYQLVVNVIGYHGNAQRINAFLESFAPNERLRMIDMDANSVSAAFEIKACIERGEFVLILPDRIAPGRTGRTAEASFLGQPASFPLGPFLLAGVLECPVLFALCLCTGPARYETLLRPLGDAARVPLGDAARVPLGDAARVPRGEREKRARELLAGYVALLESSCTRLPLQWFNFYDFWGDDAETGA